jgi:hypothetical protein
MECRKMHVGRRVWFIRIVTRLKRTDALSRTRHERAGGKSHGKQSVSTDNNLFDHCKSRNASAILLLLMLTVVLRLCRDGLPPHADRTKKRGKELGGWMQISFWHPRRRIHITHKIEDFHTGRDRDVCLLVTTSFLIYYVKAKMSVEAKGVLPCCLRCRTGEARSRSALGTARSPPGTAPGTGT